uniref:Zinc knuckle CX2CX4HX4C n=1 Tax=Tanacetum cinerariifolium TaxID=118510 RepID=A0A6L2NVK6_TANCI|nr:hypothetical protein [Tanacetum cinerariifolium]
MCVNSWGRISFACAFIEVSSDADLKNEVVMAVSNDNDEGDGYTREVIRVEYEWKPPHCVDCKIFGHNQSQCPKRVMEATPSTSSVAATHATSVENHEEGFVEASSSKYKNTKVPSPSCAKSDMNMSMANTFDVLNTVEEDACGKRVKVTDQVEGSVSQNPIVSECIGNDCSIVDDDMVQEEDII